MEQPVIVRKHRTDGRERTYRARRAYVRILELLLVLLALCALFFGWFYPVRITGDSMEPILSDGEIVLCDRLAKYWKIPGRGDMIAFTTGEGVFIKRIIALPGERIEIVEGRVFINSVPLDEALYAHNGIDSLDPMLVPEGSVFVLGDNRSKVYDSRLEAVGCIPYARVDGVLRLRIYPISRILLFL